MNTNGSNEEGLGIADAGYGEIKGNLLVTDRQGLTISKADFDRGTRLGFQSKVSDNSLMNKVESHA